LKEVKFLQMVKQEGKKEEGTSRDRERNKEN
jgi:hypothetical protein